jgi:hypothetical protein
VYEKNRSDKHKTVFYFKITVFKKTVFLPCTSLVTLVSHAPRFVHPVSSAPARDGVRPTECTLRESNRTETRLRTYFVNFVSSMCVVPRSDDQFVLARYKIPYFSRRDVIQSQIADNSTLNSIMWARLCSNQGFI